MLTFDVLTSVILLSVLLQLKQPGKAAAAAHTYFQANPEHVEMSQDLEQYKDLKGVGEELFVDREARPHQVGQDAIGPTL